MKPVKTFDPTLEGAEAAVRQVWGYDGLRPAQQRILAAHLDGRDVLGVLPTGGGKSLLYEVPALLREGVVVVVSPLIALMEDQVAGLARRGISAIAINSTLRTWEVEQAFTDARYGKYKIVYLAPERFQTDLFTHLAPHLNVSLLAVDEAHCVSEWAPHFRPAYREIPQARALLGNPPMLAVTATATPDVRKDIEAWLGLRDPVVVVQGFDRPNLSLSVRHEDNKRARVRAILDKLPGAGILYASTRRDVETWCDWLASQSVSAVAYHAGMETAARSRALADWMGGRARVVVATNAFGMGIDKPDVRFVVHLDVPASLEAYYQEAGRGGRDGQAAHAVLLWQPRDLDTQEALLATSHPTRPQLAQVFDAIGNLAQVAVGALPDAPIRVRVEKVADLVGMTPSAVRSALDVLERADALAVLPSRGDGAFRWSMSRDDLARQAFAPAVEGFVDALVRVLPQEAFHGFADVRLSDVARSLKMPAGRVERGLAYLAGRGCAAWEPASEALRVQLLVPRSKRLPVQDAWLDVARAAAEKRLGYVRAFLASDVCRRRFVLGYFGEPAPDACGRCDVCRRARATAGPAADDAPALAALLARIAETGEVGAAGVDEPTGALLRWLLREDYVAAVDALAQRYRLTPRGQQYLRRLRPPVPPA